MTGRFLAATVAMLLVAVSCTDQPLEPDPDPSTAIDAATLAAKKTAAEADVESGEKVAICHRTNGTRGFILLSIAESAVEAHLAHGDGRIGDPVPDQAGMVFDESCTPIPDRRTITVTGRWDGTSYWFYGLFTVAYPGPVDAVATVVGYEGEMRLALLGYKGGEVNTCSTYWLPEPLPPGPGMNTPTIEAHWDEVPPGTYCLNVVRTTGLPPKPPPYSWTATITYP